jgi:hypothetical protein
VTPEQIELLHRASLRATITEEQRRSLQLRNPFELSGAVAEAMQLAVSELDPMQSRVWRDAAGASMSLAAAAAAQGLREVTPDLALEIRRMNPQTGDERAAQLVADATANGNPFDRNSPAYNITAAMRLEIEAPDVAARLKAQAAPQQPAHQLTDGDVAVLQRHGYVLPS